jgi:hypothetical protein
MLKFFHWPELANRHGRIPLYLLPFQLSTVDCQLPVQSLRFHPGEK